MELKVDIKKALNDFDLEVSFTCKRGTLNVLIGPSGAGKTTIIRMIAGLQRPDDGRIAYNGETWVDVEKGIFLPPQKRRLGYVFQEYTLFPHLSVYKNVAFAAIDKNDIERLLKLFGIWHLKDSRPHKISGGERQRCAICQNLARRPQALLLDEPFSALDVEIRKKLRQELKALKEKLSIPIIHVTHDLSEALFLGDDILPVVRGRIDRNWLQPHVAGLFDDEMRARRWCSAS
jgi:molybdate transport system ATP-binding protein